jgi:adenylate cyclase
MGIGINYGEVVAGNLGSEDRIRYSVTGDTVNTGKRIETITKDHPDSIMISDSVYQKVKEIFKVKAWEPLFVKGKKEKLLVYEVLGVI